MSVDTIMNTKVPAAVADAITKTVADTPAPYDTAAGATNAMMALGVPAQLAILIQAQDAADTDNVATLMALGLPALAAVAINTDLQT
jgi:hypothetical protein